MIGPFPPQGWPIWHRDLRNLHHVGRKEDWTSSSCLKKRRCQRCDRNLYLQIPHLLSQMDKHFHMEKHFWNLLNTFLYFYSIPLVIWSVPLDGKTCRVLMLKRSESQVVAMGCRACRVRNWGLPQTYDTCSPLFTYMRTPNHTLNTLHFLGWYGCWSGSCCSSKSCDILMIQTLASNPASCPMSSGPFPW